MTKRLVVVLAFSLAGCSGAGGADDALTGSSSAGSTTASSTSSTSSSSSGAGGSTGEGGSTGQGGSTGEGGSTGGDAGFPIAGCDSTAAPTQFISCLLSYTPGPGAGFGQDRFPDIVYGPPVGGGAAQGSTDVLTLGGGGEIAFGFGGNAIVDGPGVDFILFENPFNIGGDASDPYAEPGVVGVSDDGVSWTEFPCDKTAYPFTGCGGWHPVYSTPTNGVSPFDPEAAGGDGFDLATIGVTHARFVRIRDVSFRGGTPTEGFDLDAAVILNGASP